MHAHYRPLHAAGRRASRSADTPTPPQYPRAAAPGSGSVGGRGTRTAHEHAPSRIVTDRGRPVARLSGLAKAAKLDARVSELVRTGLMRPPRRVLPAGFWEEERPEDPEGRALEAILAEREEGR
jgi:antitoxin (DNA-binding transcriptional repressor) of toxin-antitoxin stability system